MTAPKSALPAALDGAFVCSCGRAFGRMKSRAGHWARNAGHITEADRQETARRIRRAYHDVKLEIQRRYRATERGKAGAAAYSKRKFGSEEAHARSAVQRAIKTGRLVKEACRVCLDPTAEAHHYLGYAPEHALDVQWLCHRHHVEAHFPSPTPVVHVASPAPRCARGHDLTREGYVRNGRLADCKACRRERRRRRVAA